MKRLNRFVGAFRLVVLEAFPTDIIEGTDGDNRGETVKEKKDNELICVDQDE